LLAGDVKDGTLMIGGQSFSGPVGSAKPILGVRPEHLILSDDGLPMEVKVVEPTGSETMVFLTFEGQNVTAVFRERHNFKSGETIKLKPDPDHLHVFDANTGKRLTH